MKYLTSKEAMKMLNITSVNTLKKFIKNGLKCYGEGRLRRFKEEDIIKFVEGSNK